jgi:8-oxo-dGTP diphosphatase
VSGAPQPGTGRIYLVRHAKAGSRSRWEGDDRHRPLSTAGERQARKLTRTFSELEVAQVCSSPYVRCVETVRPIAEQRGLDVVHDPAFAEGGATEAALARLLDAPGGTVVCSHGDVIPAVVELLASDGLVIEGQTGWRKGSTWVLEREDGRFVRARYLPPPGEPR